MEEEFFHVDRHDVLEEGETYGLEWPGKILDDPVRPEDRELQSLRQDFPEGLSRHGTRYAFSKSVSSEQMSLPGKAEPRLGFLKTERGSLNQKPAVVEIERFFEMLRRAEFENQTSRLQSFFAYRDFEDAKNFLREYNSSTESRAKIVKVEGQNPDVKDMDLLSAGSLGSMLYQGRKYWRGEAGSDNPTWEVLLDHPITVSEVLG